jgi:hypothetical protein
MPSNPCSAGGDGEGQGGGGGGGGRGGAGANAGPLVTPGTYTVALTSGSTVLDSKPLRIVMDPEVRLADAQRRRYDALLADLHEMQRRGTETANKLNTLFPQMTAAATKIRAASNVPADVKSRFEAFNKDYDSLRVKFGVPIGAGGGGRGGGGGGGRGGAPIDPTTLTAAQLDSLRQAAQQEGGGGGGGGGGGRGGGDPRNALARLSGVKGGIMGIWEAPSVGATRQADEAKAALTKAMTEATAFLARAKTMSETLKRYDVTLNVP